MTRSIKGLNTVTSNGHERAKPLRTGDPHELGAYRLLGRLGRGGMGTVYLAKDTADRNVAVKLIHPDISDDTDFRRRFAREVEAARKVARFSTAGVIDAQLDGDPLFIVSEYVPGPNLAEAIDADGPMDGGTLESLAMGVAAALTAIHRAGVIHRDLKPANVLLSAVGPKVIDFGIARAMDDDAAVTRSSQLMGTPAYLAPELIVGQGITPASDIFSWGCLVAFAGTGTAPFSAPTVPAVLHQISSAPPNLEGLDPRLAELVVQALDKDPVNRPTAQGLLNQLVGQEDPSASVVDRTLVKSWTPPSTARPAGDDTAAAAAGGVLGAAAGAAAGAAMAGGDAETAHTTRPTADLSEQQTAALPPEDAPEPPTHSFGQDAPPPVGQSPYAHTPPSVTPPSGPQQGFPPTAPQGPPTGPGQGPYGAPGGPVGHPSGPQQPGYGPQGGYAAPHSGPQPATQYGYGPPSGPQQPGTPHAGPYGYGPPPGPQQGAPFTPQPGTHSPPFGQPGHAGPGGPGGPGNGGPGGPDPVPGAAPGGPGNGKPGAPRSRLKLYGAAAGALVIVAALAFGGYTLFGGPSFPQGTEVYVENFAKGEQSGWSDGDFPGEFEEDSSSGHIDDGFSVRATEDDPAVQAYAQIEKTPEKASVSADMAFQSGPSYATAGLFCLSTTEEVDLETVYHQYEVTVRKDGTEAKIVRSDGTAGDDLATTEGGEVAGYEVDPKGKKANELAISCVPDSETETTTIRLWVNGTFALEAEDTSSKRIKKGHTGVMALRENSGSGGDAIAHFDNYRIGDISGSE
ncbi:serine/threonine protein kinase [Murinocardiopsis flavida]|uniref:Serine/threonine protein kinase n=1 Tax=Murinocardiopsis flavida TaxID=645275 RepID=A0A2P8DUG2_9ACTN|nr:protein kinase [Murinocardiopsis flavida]PSL00842.1 serine/threonine protein kinase [Murinocardiopsis flavida]